MNRRTNIVAKSRQGQFRGASSPARRFVPLYHKNFLPFLSKPDRCSKAIRSRPNDYAVVFGGVIHPALQNKTAPTLLREERKRWGGSLNSFRLELTTISNDDLFRSLSTAASMTFQCFNDIHAFDNTSEHDVVSIKPLRLCGADEKL